MATKITAPERPLQPQPQRPLEGGIQVVVRSDKHTKENSGETSVAHRVATSPEYQVPNLEQRAECDMSLDSRIFEHATTLGIAIVAIALTLFALIPKSPVELGEKALRLVFCCSTLTVFVSGWFILLLRLVHRPGRNVGICQFILLIIAAVATTVDVLVYCFPLFSLPAFLSLVAVLVATVVIFGIANYFTMRV